MDDFTMAWAMAFTAAHMHDLRVVHVPPELSGGNFIWNYKEEKFEIESPYFNQEKLLQRLAQLAFDKMNKKPVNTFTS